MIRQKCPKSLVSLVAVVALSAITFVGCQKGAEEAKPGPQSTTQTAAPIQSAGQTIERPALSEAVLKHDPDKIKQLLAEGAKVNETDGLGKTALIYAAGDNDRAAGGGGFGGGGGPHASWADRDAVVGLLLSHHADPNATAQDGTTPLLAALVHSQSVSGSFDLAGSQNARINKVRLLLAAGAKVETHTPAETEDHLRAGATPLIAAAINGNPAPMKLLIAKGADVNAKDLEGNTALIIAARRGNVDAVQLLIANHADVNVRNVKGGTALSEATRMKTTELAKCADLLRSAGAKG